MKQAVTLKQNRDFQRLYKKGKSAVCPTMVVYCRRNRLDHNRLGITVSTKLGGAVRRNRIRRRIREVYRLSLPNLEAGYDLVLVARNRAFDVPFPKLMAGFERCCRELGLWRVAP